MNLLNICVRINLNKKIHFTPFIYNNPSVKLATGVAYVDGRTDGRGLGGRRWRRRRARTDGVQTGCGRGRRERGRHGAWLTAGGQTTIERSKMIDCGLYGLNR